MSTRIFKNGLALACRVNAPKYSGTTCWRVSKSERPILTDHTDIGGPLPVSDGWSHLLILIDRFDRFQVTVPILSITAGTVTQTLMNPSTSFIGVPATILMGRALNYNLSCLMRSYDCKTLCGFELKCTTHKPTEWSTDCNRLSWCLSRCQIPITGPTTFLSSYCLFTRWFKLSSLCDLHFGWLKIVSVQIATTHQPPAKLLRLTLRQACS